MRPRRARLEEPAFRFLGLAGDRARSLDLQKAAGYYSRALDFAPDDLQRARALLKFAEVASVGDTEAGRDARQEAYELFLQHGDELGAGEALVGLSWNAWLGGSAAEAERMLGEATELLERHPPGRELSLAYRRRAGQDMIERSRRGSVGLVTEVPRPRRRVGHPRGLHVCLAVPRSRQVRGSGTLKAAWRICARGYRLSLEEGFVRGAGIGYSNLGCFVCFTAGPEAGLEIHEAGVAFDEQRGSYGNLSLEDRRVHVDAL